MPASRTAAGWASPRPAPASRTPSAAPSPRPRLGTLALRVGSNGVSDQLLVNGQARLAGTALAVFQPGISFGKSYTLLSATSGFTGTFGTLSTQNLPGFLSASLGYSPTNVIAEPAIVDGETPGLGGHQLSVGRALDTAFNAGPGLGAMPALFSLTRTRSPTR